MGLLKSEEGGGECPDYETREIGGDETWEDLV